MFITKICREFSAKRVGNGAGGRPGWPRGGSGVAGPRPARWTEGQGRGPPVHGGPGGVGWPAGACGLGGAGSSCGGAIAGSGELAARALKGTEGRSEGTVACGSASRTRCEAPRLLRLAEDSATHGGWLGFGGAPPASACKHVRAKKGAG